MARPGPALAVLGYVDGLGSWTHADDCLTTLKTFPCACYLSQVSILNLLILGSIEENALHPTELRERRQVAFAVGQPGSI